MSEMPFEFVFQDNRRFMYTEAPHCPDCTRVLDDGWIAPDFEFDGPEFDISTTSDGCLIASDRFADVVSALDGLTFRSIPSLPGHSTLDVAPSFRLDLFMNRIRIGLECPRCNQPRFVVHEGPLTLAIGSDLPRGISRSELLFGDTADFGPDYPIRLQPVIAADADTVELLKSADLTGIHVIAP